MTDEEIEEIGGLTQEAATLAHDIAPALVQLGRRALDGDERALAALWDARDALQRVRDRVVPDFGEAARAYVAAKRARGGP